MAARLSFDERCVISAMVGVGALARQIADELGRHSSTVRREINRAGGRGFTEPRMLRQRPRSGQGVLRSRNWSLIRSWPRL